MNTKIEELRKQNKISQAILINNINKEIKDLNNFYN